MSVSDKLPAETNIDVPFNGLASMRPLELMIVLRHALEDRDVHANTWTDADTQHYADRTTFMLLENVREHDASRWLTLCRESEPAPILLAALTYCRNFSWRLFTDLATTWRLDAPPLTTAAIGLGFADGLEPGVVPLSRILQLAPDPNAASLLLASIDRLPILDVNENELTALNPTIAAQIAWFCARDGYQTQYRTVLLEWHRQSAGTPLSFWAAFALVLRETAFRQRHTDLMNWAGEDVASRAVSAALTEAITAGPLSLEACNVAYAQLHRLPRVRRLTNALRLAVFGPTNTPFIDPYSASQVQQRLALTLLRRLAAEATRGQSENYASSA